MQVGTQDLAPCLAHSRCEMAWLSRITHFFPAEGRDHPTAVLGHAGRPCPSHRDFTTSLALSGQWGVSARGAMSILGRGSKRLLPFLVASDWFPSALRTACPRVELLSLQDRLTDNVLPIRNRIQEQAGVVRP